MMANSEYMDHGSFLVPGVLTFAARDWWFASTAIPLLAATTGPLANTLSIAALVTSWRNQYGPMHTDDQYTHIPDPHWYVRSNAQQTRVVLTVA